MAAAVAESNDGGVEDGGEGWPGMMFELDEIQEFMCALHAREDPSSGEPGKGVGSQGERTDHGQLFVDRICRGKR